MYEEANQKNMIYIRKMNFSAVLFELTGYFESSNRVFRKLYDETLS